MKNLVLQKQYDYYASHEAELLEQYAGQHVVIGDQMQVTAFQNPKLAYSFGVKHYGAGNFLLHKCVPGSLNDNHILLQFVQSPSNQ